MLLVLLVRKEPLGWVLRVLLEPLAPQVQMVPLVWKVPLEYKAPRALLAYKALQVP